MSKAKVAAVSAEIYHSEGTCWIDTITHIYYNPEMPGDVLDKCGVLPEDASHWEGVGNGLMIEAIAAKDIPVEAQALGLTAGESQHYEHDSSD